jgi:hypothetical protein
MKRIILLCDGTWNEDDNRRPVSSIVRLRALLARSLDEDSSIVTRGRAGAAVEQGVDVGAHRVKRVSGRTHRGIEHIVYYDRGVGTGPWLDPIKGGAFGLGLGHNVRQAYRFLSFHYEPDDEIYVFGFSRGAFTARSLVGYVAAAGLLRREACTPARENEAWQFYRTPPNDRLSGIWSELTSFVHDRDRLRVTLLGVFDTVGALGIPIQLARRLNRSRYEFHDVTLGSISDVNLQALAVDERRKPFQAAVWRKPQFKFYATEVEQVWFAGVHSDVGGGYVDHFSSHSDDDGALDDISFDWMVKRITHFTDLPLDLTQCKKIDASWAACAQHDSFIRYYRLFRPVVRSIANTEHAATGKECTGYDRLADAIGEMIHRSVLERLGRQNVGPHTARGYSPPNVVAVLGMIEATYGVRRENGPPRKLLVVNWDGHVMSAEDDATRAEVMSLLGAARDRLPQAKP